MIEPTVCGFKTLRYAIWANEGGESGGQLEIFSPVVRRHSAEVE